jgi:hypothetical protein
MMKLEVGQRYHIDFKDGQYSVVEVLDYVEGKFIPYYTLRASKGRALAIGHEFNLIHDSVWFDKFTFTPLQSLDIDEVLEETIDLDAPVILDNDLYELFVNLAIDTGDESWLMELSQWKGAEEHGNV